VFKHNQRAQKQASETKRLATHDTLPSHAGALGHVHGKQFDDLCWAGVNVDFVNIACHSGALAKRTSSDSLPRLSVWYFRRKHRSRGSSSCRWLCRLPLL